MKWNINNPGLKENFPDLTFITLLTVKFNVSQFCSYTPLYRTPTSPDKYNFMYAFHIFFLISFRKPDCLATSHSVGGDHTSLGTSGPH